MERCFFGKNIKFIRKQMRMNQTDFGKMFDKSKVAVSYWESEIYSPSLKEIFLMSEIFGVTVNELLCTDLSERKDNWRVYNPNDIFDDNKVAEMVSGMTQEQKDVLYATIDFIKGIGKK